MEHDPLYRIDAVIEQVENAVSNMSTFLETSKAKKNQKRKHERYEKKALSVEFMLFKLGSNVINTQKYQSKVGDVSAGGMRIDSDEVLNVEKGQRLKFTITKSKEEVVLTGTGQIVRIEEKPGGMVLGIQFQMVKS